MKLIDTGTTCIYYIHYTSFKIAQKQYLCSIYIQLLIQHFNSMHILVLFIHVGCYTVTFAES